MVAYAARTARRLASELRGIIGDESVDHLLKLVEQVTTWEPMDKLDKESLPRAAERVATTYAAAPEGSKSLNAFRLVFSLGHAAHTALFALLAATDPQYSDSNRRSAAEEAFYAVRAIEALPAQAHEEARDAARHDYEILLREYGEHQQVVVGHPVVCFE
jgi:hypothetical protein